MSKQSRGRVRLNPDDGKLGTALQREFSSLYEHLYQDLDEPQFGFMRKSFADILTNRLRSQSEETSRELGSAFSKTDECISIAKARRLLRISHRAMADLIASGEVGFVIRNQGNNLGVPS